MMNVEAFEVEQGEKGAELASGIACLLIVIWVSSLLSWIVQYESRNG